MAAYLQGIQGEKLLRQPRPNPEIGKVRPAQRPGRIMGDDGVVDDGAVGDGAVDDGRDEGADDSNNNDTG